MEQAPQKIWKPNSKPQATFLMLPREIKHGLYGGSNFCGKTEALLHLPLVYPTTIPRPGSTDGTDFLRLYEHPRFEGILFRRTYKQLEDAIIPRAVEIFEPFGGKLKQGRSLKIEFPAGGFLILSYLETDKDAHQFDTAQFNLVMFEELTHFTSYQYFWLDGRCRTRTQGLPAIMRSAATPGNIGNTWVNNYFIKPSILPAHLREKAKAGGFRVFDPKTKQFRIFIRAVMGDNVDGLAINPNYANDLRNLPEAIAKAKIEGDFDAFQGQVFPEFRSALQPNEPPNALHVIKPFPIPAWWPKIISIDWGFTHSTAVYWHAISPDNRVITYREQIGKKQYIETWVSNLIISTAADSSVVSAVIDPSARQNRGEIKTIYEQVEAALRELHIPLELADNDRTGGKMLMHEFLRWEPRPPRYVPKEGFQQETFLRLLRLYGAHAAAEYERLFQPEQPETNLPKWQIFDTCSELIACIPQLVYNEATSKDANPEDVKKVDGDDPYDSVRYGLKRVHLFFNDSTKRQQNHLALASIVTDFQRNQDFTVLARRMEAHEAAKKSKTFVSKPRVFRGGILTVTDVSPSRKPTSSLLN